MTDLTVGISDPVTWGEPEQVNPKNILVEGDRFPVDEDIVAALMATINTGNGKVLPPIHLWEKQPGSDLILVAGGNRLAAHKRSEHWISPRIIRGDTPEIVRAVKLCEIEENLNRRKLSPALRKMYTAQLKVFYEEQHPETKAGKAGGLGKARKSAVPKSGIAPAFTKAHAKRTGRSPSAVAQDAAEAKTLGDETLQRIAGTSLDTPSGIAALAAMEEQERAQIIERAVAGETVSAAKPERMSEPKTTPMFTYKLACGLAAVPTPVLQKKLNDVVQCGADLPAKERRFLSDALRAVAKRFEQIADKIDNPGNAGGPLLDSAGRLIGASAGIGVAIPVDVVKGQLIRDGRVPVPGIGIIAASEDEAIRLSIDGIIILRTLPQSAAAKAGLEGAESDGGAVQDVITAANGQPVHSVSDLINILEDVGIGNTVKLTVTRDGRSRSLDVPVTDISGQTQG